MGLRHQVARLFGKGESKVSRKRRARLSSCRPRVEFLESRMLMAGFWTQLQATNPAFGPLAGSQALMLLSNGEVFAAQDTNPNVTAFGTNPDSTTWFQYAPTSSGIYVNGTWNTQATMNTARKHFPSVTLPDGRIFAIGGEFSPTVGFLDAPEIYDPVSNTWTRVADMPSPPTQLATFPSVPPTTPTSQFANGPIALLPNGDILAGWFNGPQTFVYNVASNTWRSTTAPKLRDDPSVRETWVTLPDGSILSYDNTASITNNVFQAQRFVPSMDMWVDASNAAMLNPPPLLTSPLGVFGGELGPGVLLPDGRVIWFGGNGQTAVYNPATDTWGRGPDQPISNASGSTLQYTAANSPAAVLPNGKVLIAMSPVTFGLNGSPTRIFEFEPGSNTFTDVTPPDTGSVFNNNLQFRNANEYRMLLLPTGQVLLASLNTDLNTLFGGPDLIYTPDGGPLEAWRPVIQKLTDNGNGTFTITGTNLNGVSEGSVMGDDARAATNYPLLRMTAPNGNVVYARTFNWSSTGVQTGSQVNTVQFVLPGGTTLADFNNYTVVVNGIPSQPLQFFPVKPQTVSGFVFNDVNGDTFFTAGTDTMMRNVFVFVDLNGDGKLSVLEPSTTTNFFGQWSFPNVKVGNSIIRVLPPIGGQVTTPAPGPAGPNTHLVTVFDRPISGLGFGISTTIDFGDVPASYGSAQHGLLTGFKLGPLQDGEPAGLPNDTATGDDANNIDDEDGVFIGNLTPGVTSNITVTVTTVNNLTGKLQAWIDFDQDGLFEGTEKVVTNRILGAGVHSIPVTIPQNARLNETYARFRWGFENDLGPTGSAIAGEVEDYQVTILPARPVANNDEFGNPPNLIRQGTTDNRLDVLANDTRTVRGLPQLVESEFPKATSRGGLVRVGPVDPMTGRKVLLYTPPSILVAEAPLDDTFTYNVTDGFTTSVVPGVVTIHVSLGNPVAFDDTYTVDPATNSEVGTGDTVITLDVLDNDRFPLLNTRIMPGSVVNKTINGVTQATINAADPQRLDFRAAGTFRGTEIFEYTITDDDAGTLDSKALVTVQVVDGGISAGGTELFAAGYLAELNIQILDADGIVDVGETFEILVTSIDLRPPSGTDPRGVDAAYLDILVPLFEDAAGNKLPFADLVPNSIVYQPVGSPIYDSALQGFFNTPAPGALDEAGGTDAQGAGVGAGEVQVFTVTLRARQSTGGQPIQIAADPPEGLAGNSEASDVTVVSGGGLSEVAHHFTNSPPGNPQVFKTFFRQSGDLVIMGDGEGTFVNRANSMDVDMDNEVSAGDALEVINHLNAWGAQSLLGDMPTGTGMIDVNMDSYLTASDALTVINFLNSRSHRSVGSSTSGSGGEGAPQSSGGDVEDSGDIGSNSGDIDASLTTMLPPSTTSTNTTSTQVNPAAADNLYAGMEAAQQALKKKFKR